MIRAYSLRFFGMILLSGFAGGCITWTPSPPPVGFPQRTSAARGATALFSELSRAGEAEREAVIYRELRRGNLPDCLRQQRPVRYVAQSRSGRDLEVTLWVLPDYLALGSNTDFIRMPMSPITAQRVADAFGFILPTPKLVDAIFQAAERRLRPQPIPPSRAMVTMEVFYQHHRMVQKHLGPACPAQLVAGHKKDVVLSKRLLAQPRQVAIYGWHQPTGLPIQPLSLIHGNYYADYSHGIRLINATMLLEDEPRSVAEVLQDPELAPLLSNEGPLPQVRYQLNIKDLEKRWWPRS